jgi:transcriptional regulator with XRE-family HTH domain
MTQEQLGAATGMSRSFISVLEKGRAGGCDVVRMVRLADALGVTVAHLLGHNDPRRDNEPAPES